MPDAEPMITATLPAESTLDVAIGA